MKKNELWIFEGPICCSTGICGPEPDKVLIELNDAVKKLQVEFADVVITRASLSFNSEAFLQNNEVLALVKKHGTGILPITVFNGKIVSKKKYLKYDELKKLILGR
jgi:hypothetical protein